MMWIVVPIVAMVALIGGYMVGRWWGYARGYRQGVESVTSDLYTVGMVDYRTMAALVSNEYIMMFKESKLARAKWLKQRIELSVGKPKQQ